MSRHELWRAANRRRPASPSVPRSPRAQANGSELLLVATGRHRLPAGSTFSTYEPTAGT
jgi:hypothetical protein